MKFFPTLFGVIWGFGRMVLLFFSIIFAQVGFVSPLDSLLLLVFGSGAVGIVTMFLSIVRQPELIGVFRGALLYSMSSLLVLGSTCAILRIISNVRMFNAAFGQGSLITSLIFLLLTVIGDAILFLLIVSAEPPVQRGDA